MSDDTHKLRLKTIYQRYHCTWPLLGTAALAKVRASHQTASAKWTFDSFLKSKARDLALGEDCWTKVSSVDTVKSYSQVRFCPPFAVLSVARPDWDVWDLHRRCIVASVTHRGKLVTVALGRYTTDRGHELLLYDVVPGGSAFVWSSFTSNWTPINLPNASNYEYYPRENLAIQTTRPWTVHNLANKSQASFKAMAVAPVANKKLAIVTLARFRTFEIQVRSLTGSLVTIQPLTDMAMESSNMVYFPAMQSSPRLDLFVLTTLDIFGSAFPQSHVFDITNARALFSGPESELPQRLGGSSCHAYYIAEGFTFEGPTYRFYNIDCSRTPANSVAPLHIAHPGNRASFTFLWADKFILYDNKALSIFSPKLESL